MILFFSFTNKIFDEKLKPKYPDSFYGINQPEYYRPFQRTVSTKSEEISLFSVWRDVLLIVPTSQKGTLFILVSYQTRFYHRIPTK